MKAMLFDAEGFVLGSRRKIEAHIRQRGRAGYACTLIPDATRPTAHGYRPVEAAPDHERLLLLDPGTVDLVGQPGSCPLARLFDHNLRAMLFVGSELDLEVATANWNRRRRPHRPRPERGEETA
jgi:hypothetical protein